MSEAATFDTNEDCRRMPGCCVVTPSFNQGKFIRETIESVLAQAPYVSEYFVADGGSQDETVAILRNYSDRLRWVSEPDGGQADAVNKAVRATTAEIVGWINSDDVYLPGSVRAALEVFERHPEVDVVYGDYDVINEKSEFQYRVIAQEASRWALLTGRTYVPQPGAFFRRTLWERLGGLDPSFQFAMDIDFYMRAALNGRMYKLNRPLAQYRICRGTKTVEHQPEIRKECLRAAMKNGGVVCWLVHNIRYLKLDIPRTLA